MPDSLPPGCKVFVSASLKANLQFRVVVATFHCRRVQPQSRGLGHRDFRENIDTAVSMDPGASAKAYKKAGAGKQEPIF